MTDYDITNKIKEVVGNDVLKAYDVLKEQVPELLNQIMTWELFKIVGGFILFSIIFIICLVILIKQVKKHYYERCEGLLVSSTMIGLFSLIPIIISITNYIKITLVPKLYIIQWLLNKFN